MDRPAGSRQHYLALLLLTTALVTLLVVLAVPAGAAAKTRPKPTPTPTVSPPPPPSGTAAWTVMVYIDGDNNLEKYVTLDIENELCALGSSADINVVALADRIPGYDRAAGDWTGTKLFYCWQGMQADAASAVEDWGERNMGDPATLVDFVSRCKTVYPAERYLLVFWDHGYCWYPEGWIISDETSLDTLDLDEQMSALAAVGGVDAIGCDQCQMQMVEIAACYQPYAKAVTASEETVGYTGLNYVPLIEALRGDPAMTAEQVADNLAINAEGDAQTWSSLALDARFDALRVAVDAWALALIDGLPVHRDAYKDAEKRMTSFSDPSEVDLWDAAKEIKLTVDDPLIDARCDAVMAAVDDAVTVNWTRKRKLEARGVAITWARDIDDLVWRGDVDDWGYYRTVLPFSLQTNWDEFLAAYTAAP